MAHILYKEDSIVPLICERANWKNCPEHKGFSTKPNKKLNKREADRIRKIGEDLIQSVDELRPVFFDGEDIADFLGMKVIEGISVQDANNARDAATVKVAIGYEKDPYAEEYTHPDPKFGNALCECGEKLEVRTFKNGVESWAHVGRADLDLYAPNDNSISRARDIIPVAADELTKDDLELVKLHLSIGASYLPVSTDTIGAAEADHAKNFNGTPKNQIRHEAELKFVCSGCGSQNVKLGKTLLGLGKPEHVCNQCGKHYAI
jgi:rRNA maturation endonuclease Nob1